MTKKKAIFCWSGGKDSAFCLHKVLQEDEYEICFLLTTLNREYERISMHGVRGELLERQAASIGLPLKKVYVSQGTNEEYEQEMAKVLGAAYDAGVRHVLFGDINLEDLRAYREKNLAQVGMEAVFPLWNSNTHELVREFIDAGFRTMICCVNDQYLGEEYVGRILDHQYVDSLPHEVDPCGENGEYHTFCFQGPLFKERIELTTGEKIYKPLDVKIQSDSQDELPSTRGFWYCDLV